jgi:MOSC domain-containing protein YiiM
MKILKISVGGPREVEFDGKKTTTSIFKTPVDGPVHVRSLNIDGDEQSDLVDHGGRDKAIYVYSHDYYDSWLPYLNNGPLQDSQFGENLTISDGQDTDVLIGARYRVGDIEVLVMQPRIPCFKLGIRVNDKTFPNTFWQLGRLGFYLRVEKEGAIATGDCFKLIEQPSHGISVRALYEIVVGNNAAAAQEAIDRFPHLDSGWQRRLRKVVKTPQ